MLYGGIEERTRKAKRGTLTPVWNQSFKLCAPRSLDAGNSLLAVAGASRLLRFVTPCARGRSVLTGSPTAVRFELRSAGLLKGSLVRPTSRGPRFCYSGVKAVGELYSEVEQQTPGGVQVGAADMSVERAMHSTLEEVCIALLGKARQHLA